MTKIIGIDLGTTNSCVAVMEGGSPKVIYSAEGNTRLRRYFAHCGGFVTLFVKKTRSGLQYFIFRLFAFLVFAHLILFLRHIYNGSKA